MALDPSTLLDQIETAITGLTAAIASGVQEYQLPDGRKINRGDFAGQLTALFETRRLLKREVSAASGNRIRVGKVGRNVR